jgi:hypothetical protein
MEDLKKGYRMVEAILGWLSADASKDIFPTRGGDAKPGIPSATLKR